MSHDDLSFLAFTCIEDHYSRNTKSFSPKITLAKHWQCIKDIFLCFISTYVLPLNHLLGVVVLLEIIHQLVSYQSIFLIFSIIFEIFQEFPGTVWIWILNSSAWSCIGSIVILNTKCFTRNFSTCYPRVRIKWHCCINYFHNKSAPQS